MLICLWKGCEFAFEEMAAFQEHVTKHTLQQQLQQQQQRRQLNWKQNDVGSKEEDDHGGPMAKKAKMNEDEENKLMNRGGQRKIIFLAIEVWVDVLGFVKRIQLARSVCLINCKIYEICWPRLHGNKVMAHKGPPITIGYRHELGQPPTALLLLKDHKEEPFPECPPPDYISGFWHIQINFLDYQVLAFLSLIAGHITTNTVKIDFAMKMSNLDENQVASVNGLLQMFRETLTTIHSISFHHSLSNLQFLPDVDNKMQNIHGYGIGELDIPILMEFLASPRADGKQRVMKIYFLAPSVEEFPMGQKFLDAMIDAMKEEFRTSTQRLPQPFFLQFQFQTIYDIAQSEEQNPQTDETLTITPDRYNLCVDICRHPRGQHEQWAEDARKRLNEVPRDDSFTRISVDISEFGIPFCSP